MVSDPSKTEGEPLTTPINVLCPEGVVALDIPLELACALLLNKGVSDVYTVQDVIAATSALKKFRDAQASDEVMHTDFQSAFSALAPSPVSPSLNELAPCSSYNVSDHEPAFNTGLVQPCFSINGMVKYGIADIVESCYDTKGHVLVQELLTSADEATRSEIISELCRSCVGLSMHAHGCRVIQKALEVGSLSDRLAIASSVSSTNRVVDCCVDVNANHVMQRLIEILPSEHVQFIVDAISQPFTNHSSRLSLHCYGCRVVQRVLSRCDVSQRTIILDGIISNISEMICDQFGNYVVQHAMEFGRECDREKITYCLIARDLLALSCNKFASNVIEKAVRLQTPSTGLLVKALVSRSRDEVLEVMKDRFGNYSMRAFLELSDRIFPEVTILKDIVRSNAEHLKRCTYGWHIVEKLIKQQMTSNSSTSTSSANTSSSSVHQFYLTPPSSCTRTIINREEEGTF